MGKQEKQVIKLEIVALCVITIVQAPLGPSHVHSCLRTGQGSALLEQHLLAFREWVSSAGVSGDEVVNCFFGRAGLVPLC